MIKSSVVSDIKDALAKLPGREFAEAATDLLGVLGYSSTLVPDGQSSTVDYFIERFPGNNARYSNGAVL